MTETATRRLEWAVVVPVKRLRLAKTRLVVPGAPDAAVRERLALAMALDTVAAAIHCPEVSVVVAVTDDETASPALAALGAVVVGDVPDAGLNPALSHGAHEATRLAPDAAVAAISSDLPALRAADLSAVLALAASYDAAVVADAAGTGTTLLTAGPGVPLPAAFGPRSLARHVEAGAVALDTAGLHRVCRDVDTWDDLTDAASLGVGAHTAAVLATLRARTADPLR